MRSEIIIIMILGWGDRIKYHSTSDNYLRKIREFEPRYNEYQERGGTLCFNDFMNISEYQRKPDNTAFASEFVRTWCSEFNSPRTSRGVRRAIARIHGAVGAEIDLEKSLRYQEQAVWLMREGYLLTGRDPSEQLESRVKIGVGRIRMR